MWVSVCIGHPKTKCCHIVIITESVDGCAVIALLSPRIWLTFCIYSSRSFCHFRLSLTNEWVYYFEEPELCVYEYTVTHWHMNDFAQTGLKPTNKISNVTWLPTLHVDKHFKWYTKLNEDEYYSSTNCMDRVRLCEYDGRRKSPKPHSRCVSFGEMVSVEMSRLENGFPIEMCRLFLNLHAHNDTPWHTHTHTLPHVYTLTVRSYLIFNTSTEHIIRKRRRKTVKQANTSKSSCYGSTHMQEKEKKKIV